MGCFTVISPTERNYCCKQKLASHKCICIHLTWCQAPRCCLWQLLNISLKNTLSAIHGETKRMNWGRRESETRLAICQLKAAAPWRPDCSLDPNPDSSFIWSNLIWLFNTKDADLFGIGSWIPNPCVNMLSSLWGDQKVPKLQPVCVCVCVILTNVANTLRSHLKSAI